MSAHDEPVVRPEQVNIADDSMWKKIPMIAGAVGVAALGETQCLVEVQAGAWHTK